jgi:hypothetical protein
MKTGELTGAALDWAVAKCEDPSWETNEVDLYREWHFENWKPSTDWALGGPIIECERIALTAYLRANLVTQWRAVAFTSGTVPMYGPTPLIAAMRCYVASKLGDEVEIPTELTQGETK